MSDKAMITELTEKHIPEVCQIHGEALHESFLPMLGQDFLTIMYREILNYSLGFGYVNIVDDKVVGFLLASENTDNLFKGILKKNWRTLFIKIAKKVIYNPSLVIKIFETFFYPKKVIIDDSHAELLVIAIDEKYRGKKIGHKLVDALNSRLLKEKIYRYKVSVYSNNISANEFYKSVGFKFVISFPLYHKECNVYICNLART